MRRSSSSLRRQLIVRMVSMMLPILILLWVVAYFSSLYYINAAFDRSLVRRTYALADQIEVVRGQVRVDLPVAAREILAFDQEDLLFHRIVDPHGRVVEGELNMPKVPGKAPLRSGEMSIYEGVKDGQPVRVVAFALSLKGTSAAGTVMIQVGETLSRRSAIARRATLAIVVPMLLMTLTAVGAISYGVGRGLEPVRRLRDRLLARSAFDLSPVPLEQTPAEMRPFLDEINSLLARLSEAVEAQSRFVADAAHQLRTPIAGIRAQAEAALAAGQPDQGQAALRRIAHVAKNMGELVQKLLILARVDAAENTLHLGRIDARDLMREVAMDWVPQALAQGVEIGFDETGDELAWVVGDRDLLRELLANLVDNALRHGGRLVTLGLEASTEGVIWRVSDNGPGIPASQREVVFAPFHRLSGSADGAGLGLAIVQRIARLHGATVELEAGSGGQGLTVVVRFPPLPDGGG